jgi:transposase-like protein
VRSDGVGVQSADPGSFDEVFLFRKGQKRYLYRAIDEDGVVIDVLLREHRDTASAEMFFRQAIERSGVMRYMRSSPITTSRTSRPS